MRNNDKLSSNAAMKYIRMLKKVLNDAVPRDWIKSNPLSSFKCHFKWPKREVLLLGKVY
ncbi:phage integrase SAM-like domain-containing protein [Fulvivirga sp. 2943]|uniref:Phage integrase SAM-like domain-containing protein n=1 Tax=Fulvivirga sediminis TaxID=2803949 RepID=A0A937FB49_9BACT|nr:phage integrase SAM-like domain-containing protein [Fulvivirga sediminis]